MKTFDPKCLDLAEYFLADEKPTEAETNGLARDIQQAVEDWFFMRVAQNSEPIEITPEAVGALMEVCE